MRKVREAKHPPPQKAARPAAAARATRATRLRAAASSEGAGGGDARDLKQLIAELGRLRPLRDPLSSLGQQLTPPQLHCVLWLGLDGALSSRLIAERIGCGQPTVTGVVDRLEKIGLVQRTRGTDDRRVVRVTLTAAGLKLYRVLDTAFEQRLEFFLGLMTGKDRGEFLRIMASVVASLRKVVSPKEAL